MCYRDKNEIEVSINDIVEYKGLMYCIRSINSYSCATVVIAENVLTHVVDTLLLQDIIKI
jgi:hypothetical protein